MEPAPKAVLPRPAGLALALLFAPLVASWGLGTRGAILDALASIPAGIAHLLSAAGVPGLVVVALLVLAGLRSRPAALIGRGVGAIAGLALLAAASAGSRPLPWIAALFLGLQLLAPPSRRTPGWTLPGWLRPGLPVLAVGALLLVRPFGPGLLPTAVDDAIAGIVVAIAPGAELVVLLLIGAVAALLWRSQPPSGRGAVIGAALGAALVATFGNDQALASGAALGALVGAWPPRVARGDLLDALVPLFVIVALAGARLGLTERWRCDDLDAETTATALHEGDDVVGLALAPGNLPWVVVLANEGRTLQRLTITGAKGQEAALEPPGGLLISPMTPGDPVVRVVGDADGAARIEWWDISRMQVVGTQELPGACAVRSGLAWGDGATLIDCAEGLWRVTPEQVEALAARPESWTERLRRGALGVQTGPLGRAVLVDDALQDAASVRVGPYPGAPATAPGRFVVPRGPAGHVELRGLPETIPTLYAPPAEGAPARAREMLGTVRDSVRVGVWPTAAAYAVPQKGVYVWSEVDSFVTLVDPQVTWHQAAASIGAPPRQVVVDPGSGTLYGANRCGVFAVRIPTTFPWE